MSHAAMSDQRVLFYTFDDDGSMRVMTLTPDRLGDKGQRYEIRAKDADGQEFVVGWGEHFDAWADAIAAHPSWHSRRVIDRRTEHEFVTCRCPYCQQRRTIEGDPAFLEPRGTIQGRTGQGR